MQGVPVRVEVGPRDVQQGACVMARRDCPGKEGKMFGVPMEEGAFVKAVQVTHRVSSAPQLQPCELDRDRIAGYMSSLVRGTCISTCSDR